MAVKAKDVFVIRQVGERKYWTRCGIAFVNRDNSLNLKLDLLPNVSLQIRDREPRDTAKK